jgi:hypothetical protein
LLLFMPCEPPPHLLGMRIVVAEDFETIDDATAIA